MPENLRAAESWFNGASRVLFIHAHPDDETIVTGATLAGLAAAGKNPAVLTLTRGEQGEVTVAGAKKLEGFGAMADMRVAEISEALAALKVTEHAFLGTPPARAGQKEATVYEDSGMEWGPDGLATVSGKTTAAAVTQRPAVEVLNDAFAYSVHVEADAIVSYNDIGGYGHPDHVLAHRVARAVAHGLEIPFWSIETGADLADGDPQLETLTIAAEPWLNEKVTALKAYTSQLTVLDTMKLQHVGGQEQEIFAVEQYQRQANIQPS